MNSDVAPGTEIFTTTRCELTVSSEASQVDPFPRRGPILSPVVLAVPPATWRPSSIDPPTSLLMPRLIPAREKCRFIGAGNVRNLKRTVNCLAKASSIVDPVNFTARYRRGLERPCRRAF